MCPLRDAARLAPLQPAFGRTTFQELNRMADETAHILEAAGIRPGDRIAFTHRPNAEVAALVFAAWRIGASICPLSLRLPAAQIEPHLKRLDVRVYIDSFPISPRLRKPNGPPLPFPAALLFTSGSTSLPKIAVLSLSNLLSNAATAAKWLDLRMGDRWLLNLPLYHVGGLGLLLRCILALACVILDDRDPSITHLSAVPTQLYRATPLYAHLRCLLIGGAPIPSYPERLPCFLSYGLTEMGSLVAARFNPPGSRKPFDLGFPLPERELRLSPVESIAKLAGLQKRSFASSCARPSSPALLGRPPSAWSGETTPLLATGHKNLVFSSAASFATASIGEIQVRGSCLFQGYWEQGGISKPFDEDGWFATGDIGRIGADGLAILGRKDWQFISGGENIQPEEIEQELLALPNILEAAVVPIDDPEFGQRPAAILRTADPLQNADYLKQALLERLPKFKIPIRFIFVDELPKTNLKINRKAIYEKYSNDFRNWPLPASDSH
jgi:O-succinylbenzoic acid--CoA ligase